MHAMVRKQRVETYLNQDDVEALDEIDKPNSAIIREATRRELQRYDIEGYGDE